MEIQVDNVKRSRENYIKELRLKKLKRDPTRQSRAKLKDRDAGHHAPAD